MRYPLDHSIRFKVWFLVILVCLFPFSSFAAPVEIHPQQTYYALGTATSSVLLESGERLNLSEIRQQAHRLRPSKNKYISYGQALEQAWYTVRLYNPDRLPQKRFLATIVVPTVVQGFMVFTGQNSKEQIIKLQPITFADLHNTIVMELPPQQEVEIWLQMTPQSHNSYLSRMELYDQNSFLKEQRNIQLLEALYYGAVVLMGIYNLFLFASLRQRSYLFYSLLLLGGIPYFAVMDLNGIRYLWDAGQNLRVGYAAGPTFAVLLILFCSSLLRIKRHSPKLYRILQLITICYLLVIPIAIWGPVTLVIHVSNVLALALPLALFAGGTLAIPTEGRTAKLFLAGWIVYLISLINVMLVLVGHSLFEMHLQEAALWMKFGAALEITFFSLALAQRIQRIDTMRLEAQKQVAITAEEYSHQLEIKVQERTEALQKSNATKDKFFSIIAHDLRGPIGSLAIMYNEGLKSPKDLDEELFHATRSSLKNTFRLLNDLLDWANSQTGHLCQQPKNFNLLEPVQDVLELLQPQAKHKNIELSGTGLTEELYAFADQAMIHTVIRNLISNAIKFTPDGGKINLTSSIQNGVAHLSIQDNGYGIAPQVKAKLFKLGEKVGSSLGTGGQVSSGLGLILCHEFIKKNQGEIGVESELGEGSLFWFTLPLGIKDTRQPLLVEDYTDLLTDLHCLLVDDNLLHLESSKQVLKTLNVPYQVTMNGGHALAALQQQPANLVLMDIDMPKMDGVQALKEMRATLSPQPTIIALSSYQKQELASRLGEESFDGYLQKPLLKDELLHLLHRLASEQN